MSSAINIVFDGPPGPTAGRFVEVETDGGTSIAVGGWVARPDGFWVLRIGSDGLTSADEHLITRLRKTESPVEADGLMVRAANRLEAVLIARTIVEAL